MRSFLIHRLSCVLLLAVLAFALTGCGGVTGTYAHTQSGPDGSGTVSIELKSGGAAVVSIKGDMGTITQEGTYTVDGDNVIITFEGDAETFRIVDGNLTGNAMGETLTLVKQ